MNPFEFVIAIILIGAVVSITKARFGARGRREDREEVTEDSGDTRRLKEEVLALKDRIHVLERIAVDKENTLSNEIDRLRDR